MNIIRTVQATKNNIKTVSGSTDTPIFNQVSPVGSQFNVLPNGFFASSGIPIALKTIIMAPRNDNPAPASAAQLLVRFERLRNRTINAKAASGGSGMSQTSKG